VQDIRKHKKRPPKQMDTPNLFSGMVFYADCGGTLVLHRAHTMKETQNNFMCSTYKKRGKEECSSHYIRETQLKAIVLDDLTRVTHYARQKEKLFAEHITRKNSAETRQEILRIQREMDTAKRRDGDLTSLFKRLYEDISCKGRKSNPSNTVKAAGSSVAVWGGRPEGAILFTYPAGAAECRSRFL
jgi:site-specific DNA recombinase